ncbi:MAG: FecR domain-containing protein [Gammaproteobacteria bacterium]|nr:FecR domain-containing protein [Gammaproteobacteria bacterium]
MKFRRLSMTLATLCLWVFALPSWSEEWLYTVRPGDELWNLAAKYCGSAKYTDRLADHNNLGAGQLIRPGSRIRFPIEWLVRGPAHAEVISVFGAAYLTPGRMPLEVGNRIDMGQSVETAEGSAAVRFADESVLMIAPRSRVLFNVLTAYGDSGMVDTNLRFYEGRGTSKIVRRNAGSKFRISTPSGTAAVRGTEFRIGVEPDVSFTETLTGTVGFISDVETPVPAGFGIAASERGITKEELLPAPLWLSPAGTVAIGGSVEWQPLAAADRYRVNVFRAAHERTAVAQAVVTGTTFTVPDLPHGDYQIAVRGVSAAGLEGFDSRLPMEVLSAAPAMTAKTSSTAGLTRLDWQPSDVGPPYLVEVSQNDDFTAPTEYPSTTAQLSLPNLRPGEYAWRVKDRTSVFSNVGTLVVAPATVGSLEIKTDLLQLSMNWSAVDDAERYRIQISRDDDFSNLLHDIETIDTDAEISLQDYGTHHVRIAAIAQGLQGEPAMRQFSAQSKPLWWLLSLLILPILAL